MYQKDMSFRRQVSECRRRDVIMEALRLPNQSPPDSLRALSAHNEAVLRLNRARR
jgi:hypothetical protein